MRNELHFKQSKFYIKFISHLSSLIPKWLTRWCFIGNSSKQQIYLISCNLCRLDLNTFLLLKSVLYCYHILNQYSRLLSLDYVTSLQVYNGTDAFVEEEGGGGVRRGESQKGGCVDGVSPVEGIYYNLSITIYLLQFIYYNLSITIYRYFVRYLFKQREQCNVSLYSTEVVRLFIILLR